MKSTPGRRKLQKHKELQVWVCWQNITFGFACLDGVVVRTADECDYVLNWEAWRAIQYFKEHGGRVMFKSYGRQAWRIP